jgi:hypothetical protein
VAATEDDRRRRQQIEQPADRRRACTGTGGVVDLGRQSCHGLLIEEATTGKSREGMTGSDEVQTDRGEKKKLIQNSSFVYHIMNSTCIDKILCSNIYIYIYT